jgi:transposase
MSVRYSAEFRSRALRLLEEAVPRHESEYQAIVAVSTKLGCDSETLRKRGRRAEVDAGTRPGVTTVESVEVRRLRRENAELRRANEILKTASAFFAAGLDRPTTR